MFQVGALALSISVAAAVVYVAHRRGVEIAAPSPEPPASKVAALAVSPAFRVGTDVGVPPSSTARAQLAKRIASDRRHLRTLYGLQGPSTKAEPHLAKALYEELERKALTRGRDGGASR